MFELRLTGCRKKRKRFLRRECHACRLSLARCPLLPEICLRALNVNRPYNISQRHGISKQEARHMRTRTILASFTLLAGLAFLGMPPHPQPLSQRARGPCARSDSDLRIGFRFVYFGSRTGGRRFLRRGRKGCLLHAALPAAVGVGIGHGGRGGRCRLAIRRSWRRGHRRRTQ